MGEHLPRALLESIARRDFGALAATLSPEVRFRALLPGGFVEGSGPSSVLERFEGWFGSADELEVLGAAVDEVGDRHRLTYLVRLRRPSVPGYEVMSQQALVDISDGTIEGMDLLCSGFLPDGVAEPAEEHHFDAGDMGCATGLSEEFRRRIRSIPLGDVLTIVTSDPSAKQDLPSLARLMGNTVRSVEPLDDGRLQVSIERGR